MTRWGLGPQTPIRCLIVIFLAGASPVLSPTAAALIAPVHAALARARSDQAKQGPPRDIRDKLIRLGELDRAGRDVMQMIDLSPLPPDQRAAASTAAWKEITAQDAADRDALNKLLPEKGWFTVPLYGEAASDAAWSVVQHQTDDADFMAAMLARMEGAAHRHEVNPHNFALLFDRVAMLQNREQTYGSQFVCVDHRWMLYKLADPADVDARRRDLGLEETEAQVKARIATYAPCYFAKTAP